MQYWLIKTEPTVYSIDELASEGCATWEGVRNYQARNFLRAMEKGDEALFYHSNAKPPGVVGMARVVKAAYPDSFAFDPAHRYFDPKSTPENPRWFMVDVAFVDKFPRLVSLKEIKSNPRLAGMEVARRGSRLSVQPVSEEHFREILRMAGSGES